MYCKWVRHNSTFVCMYNVRGRVDGTTVGYRVGVLAVTGEEAGDARRHPLEVVVGVLVAERHARQPQPPQVAQHRVRRLHLVQQVRVEAQVTAEEC